MAAMNYGSMSDTSQSDPQLLAAKRAMREVPATLRQIQQTHCVRAKESPRHNVKKLHLDAFSQSK